MPAAMRATSRRRLRVPVGAGLMPNRCASSAFLAADQRQTDGGRATRDLAGEPETYSRGDGVPCEGFESHGCAAAAGLAICAGLGLHLPRAGGNRVSTAGPGQLLFGFVRHWSCRSTAGDASATEQGRLALVTEAIAALANRDEPATVNAVADEIGIDQSGASRLIKNAATVGYLTMQAAPSDGRRREATVTSSGRAVLKAAHVWQERIFAELTDGWIPQRREEFQRAMADLIAQQSGQVFLGRRLRR